MGRFDALLASVVYRGLCGILGLLAFGLAVLLLVLLVRRLVISRRDVEAARQELRAYADSRFWGELPRAAAAQRSLVPLALVCLSAGCLLLAVCVLGPRFEPKYLLWEAVALAGSYALHLVAREFGMPAFVVPPESRGVPGLLAWRLEQRRAERLAANGPEQ